MWLDDVLDVLRIDTARRYFLAQRVDGVLCRVLRAEPVYATLCFPPGRWAFTLAIKHAKVSGTPGQY